MQTHLVIDMSAYLVILTDKDMCMNENNITTWLINCMSIVKRIIVRTERQFNTKKCLQLHFFFKLCVCIVRRFTLKIR